MERHYGGQQPTINSSAKKKNADAAASVHYFRGAKIRHVTSDEVMKMSA